VIAIGLILLRQPLAARGSVFALLLILLLLLGVFLPTFTIQILNGGLLLALLLTALVWQSWYLYQRSKRPRPAPIVASPPSDSSSPGGSPPPGESAPRAGESSEGGGAHG